MPNFLFQSATMKMTISEPVQKSRVAVIGLKQAEIDFGGTVRKPLRLRLSGRGRRTASDSLETTIQMSHSEAYAFSEWLDAAVTVPSGTRGLRNGER